MTRFRRSNDEIARGLTPEQALVERQNSGGHTVEPSGIENPVVPDSPSGVVTLKKGKKGEIVLRIRPAKGVDPDYFEFLPNGELTIEQDQNFYQWVDTHLDKIYNDHGPSKFFEDVLTEGIRELITKVHFTKDIK